MPTPPPAASTHVCARTCANSCWRTRARIGPERAVDLALSVLVGAILELEESPELARALPELYDDLRVELGLGFVVQAAMPDGIVRTALAMTSYAGAIWTAVVQYKMTRAARREEKARSST